MGKGNLHVTRTAFRPIHPAQPASVVVAQNSHANSGIADSGRDDFVFQGNDTGAPEGLQPFLPAGPRLVVAQLGEGGRVHRNVLDHPDHRLSQPVDVLPDVGRVVADEEYDVGTLGNDRVQYLLRQSGR